MSIDTERNTPEEMAKLESNRRIYKYTPDDDGIIEIPKTYTILSIQNQDGVPTMWAAVNPRVETIKLLFYVTPTGGEIDESEIEHYKATLIDRLGFVWHIFVRELDEKDI